MPDYIIVKNKITSVVNLSNTKEIFCKKSTKNEDDVIGKLEANLDLEVEKKVKKEPEFFLDMPVEFLVDVLGLFADKKILCIFTEEILDKFIKKNILNKGLIYKYIENGYIEKVICFKKNEKINKYGCQKVDSIIDSLIEDKNIARYIFEEYKKNFASRFIVAYKRCKDEIEVCSVIEVLKNVLIDHMVELALNKLDEENN